MVDTRPNICVLVLTYNHGRYIAQCLESLVSQKLRPSRIKVFDDCSTDDTWKIIREYVRREPELFEVHRNAENLGVIANSRRLWAAVDGDYCAYIEGDDYWGTEKLLGEYEALIAHPGAGAAYSNVAMTDEAGNVNFLFHDPNDGPMRSGNVFVLVATRRIFPRTDSCFRNYLFRTNCFHSLDWRIEKEIPTMVDYNLNLCFSERYPFAASRITEPMVFYRRHAGGISQDRHHVYLAQMLIYEKYDAAFNRLGLEQELNCRIFQETRLSTMRADFPEKKCYFYAPGAVLERLTSRVFALPQGLRRKVWTQNIDPFRQLVINHAATLFRAGDDGAGLAVWLRHLRNETSPADAWFLLPPQIFARLQSAYKKR